MNLRVVCGTGLVIAVILSALIREIIAFAAKPDRSGRGALYINPSPDRALHAGTIRLATHMRVNEPACSFDANYTHCYVPTRLSLTSWCANIGEEVKRTGKAKFTMVTGAYYFRCKHARSDVPMTFRGPPTRHFLVLLPVRAPASLLIADKRNTMTAGVAVIKAKKIHVTCDEFFLAVVQPFLAWDL